MTPIRPLVLQFARDAKREFIKTSFTNASKVKKRARYFDFIDQWATSPHSYAHFARVMGVSEGAVKQGIKSVVVYTERYIKMNGLEQAALPVGLNQEGLWPVKKLRRKRSQKILKQFLHC